MKRPLIEVEHLHVCYRSHRKVFAAAKDITLTIHEGETVGLVGESGCGKSTVGKALLGLTPKSSGSITYYDSEIGKTDKLSSNRKLQMIFQDPYSALNPRMTIEKILTEPLIIQKMYGKELLRKRASELINQVHLPSCYLTKRPHELSGGQRQRVNIARAIALNPSFIFCDEPVSSLDSIHQREVIELLKTLQVNNGISYLFVSHDLPLVCSISDQVAVMYLGEIVEWANSETIQNQSTHPYTKALFSSVPVPDPKAEKKRKKILLKGELPSIIEPPAGCPFHTRCPKATTLCRQKAPPKQNISKNHWAKCHFV